MKKIILVSLFTIFSMSCKSAGKLNSGANQYGDENSFLGQVKIPAPFCAAVRGNGELMLGHFGSLAKITEQFGAVQGYAGGSSASISNFIYESMYQSRFVRSCSDQRCLDSDAKVQAKIALMLKSMVGYTEVLKQSEEFQNAFAAVEAIQFLRESSSESSEEFELKFDQNHSQETMKHLKSLLKLQQVVVNPIITHALNPQAVAIVHDLMRKSSSGDLSREDVKKSSREIKQLHASIKSLGSFSADSSEIFFRKGIVNFAGLAHLFGKVANFYAGTEAQSGVNDLGIQQSLKAYQSKFSKFLNECSTSDTHGKTWEFIRSKSLFGGQTCGSLFAESLNIHRSLMNQHDSNLSKVFKLRLDQKVGEMGPDYIGIAATSFISGGPLLENFIAAKNQYDSPKMGMSQDPNDWFNARKNGGLFSNVEFGYWSKKSIRESVVRVEPANLKSKKRVMFDNTTWREVLSLSPAEPGLSPALKFYPSLVGKRMELFSTGGWSDLHPVQILKDAGCETVVYITRKGEESVFAAKIARILGMSAKEERELSYLGKDSNSGFNDALQKADVVWCTDWNRFQLGKTPNFVSQVFDDSYQAPFAVNGEADYSHRFVARAIGSQNYRDSGLAEVGCTAKLGSSN